MNMPNKNTSGKLPKSQLITANIFLLITAVLLGLLIKSTFFDFQTTAQIGKELLIYLVLLISVASTTFELFTKDFKNYSYSKELKIYALILCTIGVFYLLFFFSGKFDGNTKLIYLNSVFIILFVVVVIIGFFFYKKLDELQQSLIIKSLAFSGISTITLKLGIELYIIFINSSIEINFNGIWMTVYLIFSSLIAGIVLFYEDDNDHTFE